MRTVERTCPFLLSLTLAACGGGGQVSPDAPIVVEPDAPPVVPTPITIDTVFDPPELVAVRDGLTADWRVLPVGGTSYTTTIHGPYMVTVVCDDGGGFSIYQFVRTPDDETLLEAFCFDAGVAPAQHQVTAEVARAGTVILGFSSQSSDTPNWQLDLSVDEGTYDLIAMSSDRVLVNRGLDIAAATTLPAIDADTGAQLVAAPLTAPNATPAELLHASLSLFTMSSFAFNVVAGDPGLVQVLPDTVLLPSDRQRLSLTAFDGAYSRSNRKTDFHAGDPTAFTLPDPITGAQFTVANGTVTAKWGTLPAHDSLSANLFAFTSPDFVSYIYQDLSIGEHAEAAKEATLDTAGIPGFKAEWKIDTSKEYFRTLTAFQSGVGETSSAAFDESVNSSFIAPFAPAKLEKLRARRELRRR